MHEIPCARIMYAALHNMEISNLRRIDKCRLTAFLKYLDSKDADQASRECLMVFKTLLYTCPDFTYDTALDAQSGLQAILNSVCFDNVEPDHMIRLKPILDQGANITVYARYIKSVLDRNDKTLNSILMDIWTHLGPNVLKLPVSIHEKSIEVNPVVFEKTVLSTISLWQIKDLIDMCSKSPLVFQTCSSIFNELLIKLDFSDKFMNFLISFINSVKSQCENDNIDYIDLYPSKCRYILTLRAIRNENSSLVPKHCLYEEVEKFALHHPRESMCLISHFPDLYVPN